MLGEMLGDRHGSLSLVPALVGDYEWVADLAVVGVVVGWFHGFEL